MMRIRSNSDEMRSTNNQKTNPEAVEIILDKEKNQDIRSWTNPTRNKKKITKSKTEKSKVDRVEKTNKD